MYKLPIFIKGSLPFTEHIQLKLLFSTVALFTPMLKTVVHSSHRIVLSYFIQQLYE